MDVRAGGPGGHAQACYILSLMHALLEMGNHTAQTSLHKPDFVCCPMVVDLLSPGALCKAVRAL